MSNIPDEHLLSRYLSDECSNEEKEIIETWIRSNPENRKLMEFMKRVWDSPKVRTHEWNKNKLWMKIIEGMEISESSVSKTRKLHFISRVINSRILKIAAILLITVSLPYFYKKVMKTILQIQRILTTEELFVENGKQAELTLGDGTKVTLDAGSKFSYPKNFSIGSREVFLNGEGFFEVLPSTQKPFIIYANEAVIEVLGTKFNVRAWQQNQKVQVVVTKGKVSLSSKKFAAEKTVVISQGEASILRKNEKPSEPRQVNVEKHLGWINREMFFDNVPLYEILNQIERWYGLRIILTDNSLASDYLTVHIQNKPVEDILDLIAVLMEFKYERTENNVVFSPKEIN